MIRWMVLALCLVASAVVGCSSSSDASSADDAGTVIGCAHDPRVETFSLGMMHKGDTGQLSFVIAGSTFDPPAARNVNTWTVKILDASGQPVKDATLTFPKGQHLSDPWMPDHSHGTLPVQPPVNHMDGTYTVTPLYFSMGGVWSTLITATSGSATDSTTFTFCVGS